MTVTLSRATLETTLEEVSRIYFSNRRTLRAETKKAEELDAAFRRGLAEAVANFLFLHRCTSLPRFKTVPPIYESEVRAILDPVASDFINGTPIDKGQICDGVVDALLELAVPKDLKKADEEQRRYYVLHGVEKAHPEDAEWISEMAEAKRREVEELMDLLKPVGFEKVNHTLVPKERPEPVCVGTECRLGLSTFSTAEQYASHLRIAHFLLPSDAGREAVADWSRRTTWLNSQRPTSTDSPTRVTASGAGVITTSPTLGDTLGDTLGAVIGAARGVEPKTEFFISSGEPPIEKRDATPTRVIKDSPQA